MDSVKAYMEKQELDETTLKDTNNSKSNFEIISKREITGTPYILRKLVQENEEISTFITLGNYKVFEGTEKECEEWANGEVTIGKVMQIFTVAQELAEVKFREFLVQIEKLENNG